MEYSNTPSITYRNLDEDRLHMDNSLTEQIHEIIESLLLLEAQSKQMLSTAKEKHLSFGLTYNYVDDDIAQIIGWLRYMELVADRQDTRPDLDG